MTTIPDVTFQTEPALAERRPVSHRACIEGMLAHADLTFTARVATRLVGVSRSMTDFHYCCYLSDLASTHSTRGRASAPGAVGYYPKVGFERHPQAWTIPPSGGRVR